MQHSFTHMHITPHFHKSRHRLAPAQLLKIQNSLYPSSLSSSSSTIQFFKMAKVPLVTLKNGVKLPIIGYGNGTALFASDTTSQVEQALKAGFTLIDTAQMYKNTQYVGNAFPSTQKPKVVAKIDDMAKIKEVAYEERKLLGVNRLDVLLLHWPPRGNKGLPTNVEAWKLMEELKEEGVVETIGVSNWLASDIEDVIHSNPKHPIQINQIEHHPLMAGYEKQTKLLDLQKKQGITTLTYGALTPITQLADKSAHLIKVLEGIAKKENDWSTATVLFKWASQTTSHGDGEDQAGIAITTGRNIERASGYLNIFASRPLTEEEVQEITQAAIKQGAHKTRMLPHFNGRD